MMEVKRQLAVDFKSIIQKNTENTDALLNSSETILLKEISFTEKSQQMSSEWSRCHAKWESGSHGSNEKDSGRENRN